MLMVLPCKNGCRILKLIKILKHKLIYKCEECGWNIEFLKVTE